MLDALQKRIDERDQTCSNLTLQDLYETVADHALSCLEDDIAERGLTWPSAYSSSVRTEVAALAKNLLSGVYAHELLAYRLGSAAHVEDAVFNDLFARDIFVAVQSRYVAVAEAMHCAIISTNRALVALVQRLEHDDILLRRTFGGGESLGELIEVSLGVSDRHAGGATVAIMGFSSGMRVVYKPRSLAIDIAAASLVSAIGLSGVGTRTYVPKVIDRGAYGWCEHVPHRPLSNPGDAAIYYERCGSLLLALYLLGCTDMHHGNLVANGDVPVLVDVETLLHQRHRPLRSEFQSASSDWNVLHTGFLPRWSSRSPDQAILLGGLAQAGREHSHNLPFTKAGPVLPTEHVEKICAGFSTAYRRIVRDGVEEACQILDEVSASSLETRYVFRGTAAYTLLMRESLRAENLGTSTDRLIVLEKLANVFLANSMSSKLPPSMFYRERDDMYRMDIPRFTCRTGSTDLLHDGDVVCDAFFDEDVTEIAKRRFRGLSESDLELQLALVRSSFDLQPATLDEFGKAFPTSEVGHHPVSRRYIAAYSPRRSIEERCLTAAISVGDYLIASSRSRVGDDFDWLVPSYQLGMDRYSIRTIDHSLFQGRSGVGIFFAHLAAETGDQRYLDAARRTIAPTRALLDSNCDILVHLPGSMGLLSGVAGIAYGIMTTGRIIGDEELVERGAQALGSFTREQIEGYPEVDLASGVAGLVLAVAAAESTGPRTDLSAVRAVGLDVLVKRAKPMNGGHAWVGAGGRLLSGMSHGASGIALALARAGGSGMGSLVEGALLFEDSTFSVDRGNWRDCRFTRTRFGLGWGHGAPGIGICGIEIARATGIDDRRLSRAVDAVRRFRGDAFDYVVSGFASHLALADAAYRFEDDPQYRSVRDHVATRILDRAERAGRFAVPLDGSGVLVRPGLFNGLAGIGLALLQVSGNPRGRLIPLPWSFDGM